MFGLVSAGPGTSVVESACAENSACASWMVILPPSGRKYSDIQAMWCWAVFGWATALPRLAETVKTSPALTESGASITGACFSTFQSAFWIVLLNSDMTFSCLRLRRQPSTFGAPPPPGRRKKMPLERKEG